MSHFDKEYYVLSIDGAPNHPLLAWGSVDYVPFLSSSPIEDSDLEELPLKIIFGEPYPQVYEMTDFLMLDAHYAGSEKLKKIFEKLAIYGVQFFPVEIEDHKGEIIKGHNAIHFWNKLPAIDKNNYVGEEPNMFGNILDLQKFSLDTEILNQIPLEKRLVFGLAENSIMILVHQSIYEIIKAENLTGFSFFRVEDWDSNVMFR